ncbi:hypothetical protein Rsub_10469 [Raphidocelis subcapitata]|uniref:FAM194 C-terminal domain-containing protein n=1 Tax=Raphidocelis subcapitata TaxID=307507 RepID=A0A2V0PEY1_9CHLO|nr:hypothetical protein Rsub_10469 [Raphidocelis subcapitata]|eukprot:GBF98404.1 hypothetical protein Rsub_10469 [Raphidocelis subcapitata]
MAPQPRAVPKQQVTASSATAVAAASVAAAANAAAAASSAATPAAGEAAGVALLPPPQPPARSRLEVLSSSGEGTIFYPSGHIALTVCRSDDGFFHMFSSDTDRLQVLANFDPDGCGGVNYPDGKPWLVVTREGWSVSSPEGRITCGGRGPRANSAAEPITLEVSPQLTVTFVDRQRIEARLQAGDVDRVLQCGEYSRRQGESSHLEKAGGKGRCLGLMKFDKRQAAAADGAVVRTLPGGKLELDVPAIRRRIEAVGSVYVPKGPQHSVTQRPGVGSLKTLLAGVRAGSPVSPVLSGLDGLQARVRSALGPRHAGLASAPGSRAASAARGAASDAAPPGDFGAPPLTAAQRRIAARLARADASRPTGYVCRRRRLQPISAADFEAAAAAAAAPRDTLIAACVLADWSAVASRLERKHVEAAAFELSEAARERPGGDAARVALRRLDASEAAGLRRRLGAGSVPFFVFLWEGRVVYAGNDIWSKEDLVRRALEGVSAGRRGQGKPLAGFAFADTALDALKPEALRLRRVG